MEKDYFQTLIEIPTVRYVLCKPRKHYSDKGKILNFISEKSAWPCRCDLCVHSTLYCQISSFIGLFFCVLPVLHLSSPRTKRAGPKGLRAESARAFTGRRNSHTYMQKAGDSWDISPQIFLDFPQNFRLRTQNQYCTQAIA